MIITEALDFIESAEMREHLQTVELKNMNAYLTLICESPKPLTEKAKALAVIADKYESDKAQGLVDAIGEAKKELNKPRDGSVFTLTYVMRDSLATLGQSDTTALDWPIQIPVAHYTSFIAISEEIRRRRNSYDGQLHSTVSNRGFDDY